MAYCIALRYACQYSCADFGAAGKELARGIFTPFKEKNGQILGHCPKRAPSFPEEIGRTKPSNGAAFRLNAPNAPSKKQGGGFHSRIPAHLERAFDVRKPEKNRSRRLRKKLHLGEFKELGFEFSTKVKSGVTPEAVEQIVDRFVLDVIEARGLELGGGLDGGFIAHSGRGSASEADRQAVGDWLAACGVVESIQIGELSDAWYLASD